MQYCKAFKSNQKSNQIKIYCQNVKHMHVQKETSQKLTRDPGKYSALTDTMYM